MKILSWLISLFLLTLAPLHPNANAQDGEETIVLFAAASTYSAVEAIKGTYQASHPNIKIRVSYGASALLAQQIVKGAPADIFLSANIEWINWLQDRNKTTAKPQSITRNRLMLVSSKSAPTLSCPPTPTELARAVSDSRFVLADPNVSPLGYHSKEALISLGLWQSIEQKLAIASNATLALKMVERGAAPYGIAYASNATSDDAVKLQCLLPASSHSPIDYYLLRIKASSPATADFMHYLSHESDQHWAEAGFYIVTQDDTRVAKPK